MIFQILKIWKTRFRRSGPFAPNERFTCRLSSPGRNRLLRMNFSNSPSAAVDCVEAGGGWGESRHIPRLARERVAFGKRDLPDLRLHELCKIAIRHPDQFLVRARVERDHLVFRQALGDDYRHGK